MGDYSEVLEEMYVEVPPEDIYVENPDGLMI